MSSGESGGQGVQQQQSPAPQQVVTTSTSAGQMVPTSGVQVQVQQQQQQQPSPAQQQQQASQQQQQQQQIQLQQTTTTTAIHGAQQHQASHGGNMQQLLIQQPIQQNSPYLQNLQQLFNSGQILMPGNILSHNLNSQIQPAQLTPSTIQVIGKPFQPNQLSAPHMLTAGNYAIPTSGANNQVNQSYIIGNLGNLQAPLFQHQQGVKQADMQKVLSQQIGTQLPQGLTWTTSPHTFLTSGQNSYLIRGAQPEQQLQFLQQQLQNNATHQQFMPIGTTATQLPNTSISQGTNPVQHSVQVQSTLQHQGQQQQQQQQSQGQPHPIQPQPTNVVSIKAPATLQPKPPLQIQPSPQQTQQLQQQQQLHQQQQQIHQQLQVTMTQQQPQQIQMIPQPNSSQPQSISISQPQPITAAQLQQAQQQFQNQQQQQQQQPRHVTILPQAGPPQQMIIQQQQAQQPQPIRPNYTATTLNVITTQAQVSQGTATNGPAVPQPRAKIRKTMGRGTTNGSPTQQPRPMFPRGTTLNPIPTIQQKQIQGGISTTLTKVTMAGTQSQIQHQQLVQPLKTINLSALQPNLPDATLTPLTLPHSSQHQQLGQQTSIVTSMPQQLHVFTTTSTHLPSPHISITPTHPPPAPQKKDESSDKSSETKGDTEKENSKTNGSDESEEMTAKQKLPKAMVKPQVLTHVIEGFVIQEAAEPFPMPKNIELDEPPKKKSALSSGEMGKCEMCGKVDLKAKFKKNKRFCSSACAKGMKASQQHQQAQNTTNSSFQSNHNNFEEKLKKGGKRKKWGDQGGDGDHSDETNSSVGDTSTLSPNEENMELEEPKVNPMKWGVCEVVDFVKSLPGCAEYAEDFAVQEIDGQALMLLKEDHLMSAMGMKLGPALKLCARIDVIRLAGSSNSNAEGNGQKA